MLVANEISKNQYVGDGSATEFAYTFPILDSTHIEVYRQLPTETALDAKLVPAEEYTVEGAGVESGGKVVFKTAPSSGTKLSILRNVPITQLYQYQELDSFPAESHENALAKLTMICQSMDERLDRAIVVSPTDTVTPDELRNNIFEASQEAKDSAAAAKDSETAAAESESNAAASASAAASSESSASSSAAAAAESETAAAESESNAAASASAAASSESSASSSAAAAASSAAAAASSATAAASSENNAAASASAAAGSAAAATSSENTAAASASAAAGSAAAAASSESSAAASASAAAGNAAAAAESKTAAASSAAAAAGSESNAANSAAAILELKIEVNTLNPGEQATASYDPVTGILTLGVPKGDSGDAAIATSTSLGSVMPQTGNDDGLELGTDGKLRVRKASASQRGGVLASTTAAANTVPQAGEDGALDESWTGNCLKLSGGTLTGAVAESLAKVTGEAVTLNLKTANNFTHNVTANTAFTVTARTGNSFQLGTLILTNGGSHTVTWPSSFKWADGAPPSLMASGIDVITFFTIDGGTTYYAAQAMTGIA